MNKKSIKKNSFVNQFKLIKKFLLCISQKTQVQQILWGPPSWSSYCLYSRPSTRRRLRVGQLTKLNPSGAETLQQCLKFPICHRNISPEAKGMIAKKATGSLNFMLWELKKKTDVANFHLLNNLTWMICGRHYLHILR